MAQMAAVRDPQNASPYHDTVTLEFFAFLWAAFTFFHQSKWTWWTRTPIESLQTAAAICVIFRPSSLSAFLALVSLQLADLVYTLPDISNHSIFSMFINLTIVSAAVVHVVQRPGVRLDKASLLRLFAPAARVQVLILYFYVVLHKLNTDFFSTVASCAVDHSLHLSGLAARVLGRDLFPAGEFARMFVIVSTLAIEAAIPLLLAFRRTRIPGVALGIAFHYLLGVNIYHDFSGMIFALYLLFLPANFAERVFVWWRGLRLRDRLTAAADRMPVPAGLWGTAILIGLLVAAGNNWPVLHPIFFGIWIVYGVLVASVFAATVYSQRSFFVYEGRELRTAAVLMPIPLLVLLNGWMPYLGLKTGNSFAMFSNLRTEGGKSNHLVIPASIQIFDFQRDLVTVESSNIRELRLIAERGTAVPWFTVRRHVAAAANGGRRGIQLAYIRDGIRHATANAEADPEFAAPIPWLAHKFLVFREVDTGPRQMCRH